MITLTVKAVVALIAAGALALAPKVSAWIQSRGSAIEAEVGSGDAPGSRDRGPDGMKM